MKRRAAAALRAALLLAAAVALATADCVTDPTAPSCSTFKLPDATVVSDLQAMCGAMHFMTGCSLYKACNATTREHVGADPTICDPFQQLATLCAHDTGMGGMGGCRAHYNSMCAKGSRVPQCAKSPGFELMTTADANKRVRSICEEMTMDGCERCTPAWKKNQTWGGPNCDMFAVYGWLCVQMPDMWQCTGPGSWEEICRKDPTLYVCVGDAPALTDKGWWRPSSGGGGDKPSGGGGGGGGDQPAGGGGGGDTPYGPGPQMKMYFFNQLPFWLLFRDWTPSTTRELAGAWFAIFFLGVFYELLQTLKFRVEAAWLAADAERHAATAPELVGPQLGAACCCEDAGVVAVNIPSASQNGGGGGLTAHAHAHATHSHAAPGACCAGRGGGGGSGGAGPLGEGAEGGCCSSSKPAAEIAALTVPLAGAASKRTSFDQECPVHSSTGGRVPPRRRGARGAAAWAAAARRPGGALDPVLFARDAARCGMTFVTTALSYLLMLAAMSFHVGIFFAVCAGIAVGTALFGRFRSYVAVAHQDRCCC